MFPDPLRLAIGAVALVVLAVAGFAMAHGQPALGALTTAIVVLIGVLFERWRYSRLDHAPPAGFEPTAERFREPGSGVDVTVFVNRATGERRYVRSA